MENDFFSDKDLIFNKLIDILSDFHDVCVKNNLSYSLHGGTLLGAIRHNGFIPWDDDIDVLMPREDFNKLQSIAKRGAFEKKYFLQSPETENGAFRMFLKLRDSTTCNISIPNYLMGINEGMFLDIFPIDYFPNSKMLRKILIFKLTFINRLLTHALLYEKNMLKIDNVKSKIKHLLLLPLMRTKIITSKEMFLLYHKIASKYSYKNNCSEIYDSTWIIYDNNYHWPKEYIENGFFLHKFENHNFYIVKEYDSLLKAMFGDYMIPIECDSYHGWIANKVDVSYDIFIKNNKESIDKIINDRINKK